MKKRVSYSNLLDVQRENYKNFLVSGLKSRLHMIRKINHLFFNLYFHENNIKFKKPKFSPDIVLLKGQTYFLSLYIPLSVKYLKKKIVNKKYILLGKIPMLTRTGSFLINGNTRVLINQLVKSPGVYVEKDEIEKQVSVTIIPFMGSWLTLKCSKTNEISVKIDKMKVSIPILIFLQAFGLTDKKLSYILLNLVRCDGLNKTLTSLSTLNMLITSEKLNKSNVRSFLFTKFINKYKYDLGALGRLKLNKVLYLRKFYTTKSFLMPEDILGFTNFLLKKSYEKRGLENVDDLKNKSVRGNGDLLSFQLNLSIFELKNSIIEKLTFLNKKIQNLKFTNIDLDFNELVNSNILTKKIFSFFLNSQISQILDEINPLSEITHKRKITALGITGSKKTTNNLTIREIHPSHFGKICGIETSEGKNAGLILTFSRENRLNKFGFIETPFYV